MHQFGSTGILTGYIKQLLKSFNLPTVRIYTKAEAQFIESQYENFISEAKESLDVIESYVTEETSYLVPYIKDGEIQTFIDGKWRNAGYFSGVPHAAFYSRGQYIPNKVRNLKIKDNVYDYYTHEYLGDYLRFLRDFDDINLMSLYNCFSNRLCDNIDQMITTPAGQVATFNAADSKYKIYMLPIKLFKDYTIAIDSTSPIELCCGVYTANLVTDGFFGKLPSRTYVKKNFCQFSTPFLYEDIAKLLFPLINEANRESTAIEYIEQKKNLAKLALHERDLKLFIKVPAQSTSSIVILEGDFCTWNNYVLKPAGQKTNTQTSALTEDTPEAEVPAVKSPTVISLLPPAKLTKYYNRTIISNELLLANQAIDLIAPLQLLRLNTQTQVPFANRLITYLMDNAITDSPEAVSENIALAQTVAQLHFARAGRKAGDVINVNGELVQAPADSAQLYRYSPSFLGLWDDALQAIFYQSAVQKPTFATTYDVLGYVDKDIEKYFVAEVPDPKSRTGVRQQTIMNTELWEA